MVVFFAMRLTKPELKNARLEIAKSLWLIGSLLSLLHAIATMAFHHQFQHALAYEETTLKTQMTLGIAVGIGIWFNYAFVILWLLDAFWIGGFASSYFRRRRALTATVYCYLSFIAFNGAIVFESGPMRWIGILSVAFLVFLAFQRLTGDHQSAGQGET